MKTDRQTVIELQRGKPVDQVIRDVLEKHRGEKSQVTWVALDLGITDATVYSWCKDFGIDIDDYTRPAPDPDHAPAH